MIYYLEPYKTREYAIITSDWSTTSFEAAFSDGEIIHVESEKALYFYLEFTEFTPNPTTKWKPEEFEWKTPIRAALILHYDEYQINNKVDGKWVKKTEFPGVVEKAVCEYLLKSEYLNKPIVGYIDFGNNRLNRETLGGNDEEEKKAFLDRLCGFSLQPEHNPNFLLPAFNKKKSSSGNYTKTAYQAMSITENLQQKEKYVIDILARILGIVHVEDKITYEQVITALSDLEGQNPQRYKIVMNLLSLITK